MRRTNWLPSLVGPLTWFQDARARKAKTGFDDGPSWAMRGRCMSPDLMPLTDILLAINRAIGFIHGYDAYRFRSDKRTQWAVYSQVIVIGEAARRISRVFQNEHPEIPWAEMTGMRNKLV